MNDESCWVTTTLKTHIAEDQCGGLGGQLIQTLPDVGSRFVQRGGQGGQLSSQRGGPLLALRQTPNIDRRSWQACYPSQVRRW